MEGQNPSASEQSLARDRARQRLYAHMDWYLQETLGSAEASEWTIAEIRKALGTAVGVKPFAGTILDYNAGQFQEYQTAPLERAGPDTYRLNDNYYRLFSAKVRGPRQNRQHQGNPSAPMTAGTRTKRGRPPKYEPGEAGDLQREADAKNYQTWYHRLLRRPETTILGEIFGNDDDLDVPDVRRLFFERTSVDLGPQAMSTVLKRYAANGRGPPFIEEARPGTYRRIAAMGNEPS